MRMGPGDYSKQEGFIFPLLQSTRLYIVAAEYFFDADPVTGNGTAASVGATGGTVNFTRGYPHDIITRISFH